MLVAGLAELEAEYGASSDNGETAAAVEQFFVNGGTQAWIVRVADTTTNGPPVEPPMNAAAAEVVLTGLDGDAEQVVRVRAGRQVRGRSAANPGRWGNTLHVEVDDASDAPGRLFNLTVREVVIEDGATIVRKSETFRNLCMDPGSVHDAFVVVNESSTLVQLDREGVAPPTPAGLVAGFRPAPNGTLSGALPATPVIPADGQGFEVDTGEGPVQAAISYGETPQPTSYQMLAPFLEAAIRAAAGGASVPERARTRLAGATVGIFGDGSAEVPLRLLVRPGAAGALDASARLCLGGAAADVLRLTTEQGAVVNARLTALTGGRDGASLDAEGEPGPVPLVHYCGSRLHGTGLYALDAVDAFNVLCVPEAASLPGADMRAFYTEAAEYVQRRRAMLLVDVPAGVADAAAMQGWLSENDTLRRPNAAVYFPRLILRGPAAVRPRAASGTIAGIWARTDAAHGPWRAPAGTDAQLRNVERLAADLFTDDNATLNGLGVNCLRRLPIYDLVCWGARTLDGADALGSEWKYLAVRRTALFIEESLYRATEWVVLETNDELSWSRIRQQVGAFLEALFRRGAFRGATPRDAYFVKCDAETTSQQDIDAGFVNIVVGFAAVRPAEFTVVHIRQRMRPVQ